MPRINKTQPLRLITIENFVNALYKSSAATMLMVDADEIPYLKSDFIKRLVKMYELNKLSLNVFSEMCGLLRMHLKKPIETYDEKVFLVSLRRMGKKALKQKIGLENLTSTFHEFKEVRSLKYTSLSLVEIHKAFNSKQYHKDGVERSKTQAPLGLGTLPTNLKNSFSKIGIAIDDFIKLPKDKLLTLSFASLSLDKFEKSETNDEACLVNYQNEWDVLLGYKQPSTTETTTTTSTTTSASASSSVLEVIPAPVNEAIVNSMQTYASSADLDRLTLSELHEAVLSIKSCTESISIHPESLKKHSTSFFAASPSLIVNFEILESYFMQYSLSFEYLKLLTPEVASFIFDDYDQPLNARKPMSETAGFISDLLMDDTSDANPSFNEYQVFKL